MKLIRYGQPGHEKPGVILHDQRFDVSAFGEDYNEAFFATDGLQPAWPNSCKPTTASCPPLPKPSAWARPWPGRPKSCASA